MGRFGSISVYEYLYDFCEMIDWGLCSSLLPPPYTQIIPSLSKERKKIQGDIRVWGGPPKSVPVRGTPQVALDALTNATTNHPRGRRNDVPIFFFHWSPDLVSDGQLLRRIA